MKFLPKPKLIGIAQLNEKSQLVIPKAAREEIGLEPGDRVVIAIAPFGNAIIITKPEALEAHMQEMVKNSEESIAEMKSEISKLQEGAEWTRR